MPSTTLASQNIVAFVGTSKPAKAKAFYADVLGLPLVDENDFALVFDANGTMFRVTTVEKVSVAQYTVLGWQVDDIASAVNALGKAGVTFEHYEGMGQDNLGVWSAPSGARVAWFKDPDGNLLSITEF